MAATIGISGLVAASGSGDLDNLLDTATAPSGFTLNVTADSFDSTVFGSSLVAADQINGMYSWTANVTAVYARGEAWTGNTGGFTWSDSSYDTLVTGYTLNLSYDSFPSTSFDTSGNGKEFAPGLLRWNGTAQALIDSSTALTLPHAPGATVPTLTMLIATDDTEDNQLSGTATITSIGPSVAVGARNEASIGFQGKGNLLVEGDVPLFHDTHNESMESSATDTITFTAASGRTYSGTMFLNSATLNVTREGLITVSMGLQGTGAMTIA